MRLIRQVVSLMLLAALLGTVAAATPDLAAATDPDGGRPGFSSTPTQGPTGTDISVFGERCVLPGSTTPADGVVVRLVGGGEVATSTTLPVEADGRWSGQLYVPAGTAARAYHLEARCVSPGYDEVDPVVYARREFTVTGEGSGASPEALPTPAYNGGIEGFPTYDGQSTCSPNVKPGMASFRSRVLSTYGGGDKGVSRACSVGATSEHKEGRAWDWAMNAGSAGDRARVDDLMRWLFATDNNCNRFANARRIGIMYIIWNRRMFRMYDTDRGWAPYSGPSPHTDHVHFSLTRAGGNAQTSYWNPTFHASPFWQADQHTVRQVPVNATWGQPVSGDFDGDGRDDILWYRPGADKDYVWYATSDGHFTGREVAVGGNYRPLVGDFNGDCVSDVFWYGPGDHRDYQWFGRSNRTFKGVEINVSGDYAAPTVGDFNGDRAEDILWYRPGTGNDVLWSGTIFGFRGRAITQNGTFEPLSGDFNGDGPGDILWYGEGASPDRLWYGTRSGGFTPGDVAVNRTFQPLVGDYNGDQREDVFWYGLGDADDTVWLGTANRSFVSRDVDVARSYEFPATGDFGGNGRDDILFHGNPNEPARLWLY